MNKKTKKSPPKPTQNSAKNGKGQKGAKKKVKRVKGFQMNKKTGHVSLAFWQKDKDVKSVGFTHNKDDPADKVQMAHNIDPNDSSECFAKTKVEKQKFNTYRQSEKLKNYRIHKDDKGKITKIISADKKGTKKVKKKRK